MKITTIVEHEDGSAEYTANLSPNELQFVVEFGLNVLLQKGISVVDVSKSTIVTGSEELQ